MAVPYTFQFQTGNVPAKELDDDFAYLYNLIISGGGGSGNGATLYLFNSSSPTNSLCHKNLTVGQAYGYNFFGSNQQDGSFGIVYVADATGNGTVDGSWHYDSVSHKSFQYGFGSAGSQQRLFFIRPRQIDIRSWGLDCVSGTGGDSIWAALVIDIRNAYFASIINTSLGPPITGVGVTTPTTTIDIANAPYVAPELCVVSPTFATILPVMRAGRPTSGALNNRLDNPQRIYGNWKGNGSTNFSTVSNQIGLQIYDIASPQCEIDVNASRLYAACDIATNSEKLDVRVGAYACFKVVTYSPVQVSNTYGGSTPILYPLWPYLANSGSWNPSSNTPFLSSGVGTKGVFYKASATSAISPSIDGINAINTGDLMFFDGTVWNKRTSINFSPDSNRVVIYGENNAQLLYVPDAADCSGTIIYDSESRFDPGPAYDITNFQGFVIPYPGIYDANGKMFVHEGWQRAGDQRLFYYGNKDNGMDTTVLAFHTDHIKGTLVRVDRALNVHFRDPVYKDCQNGVYNGNTTPIPCPVVWLGAVNNVSGFFSILQALNREGLLAGNVPQGLVMTNQRVRCTIKMGTQTGYTDFTSGKTLVAARIQGSLNSVWEFVNTQGQILVPDLCIEDGVTPTFVQGTTIVVDEPYCVNGALIALGSTVGCSIYVRGAMSFSAARAAVANWTGITSTNCAKFESITDRQSAMTYDGSQWWLG